MMEGSFKRRMRNAMKRLQEEEELSRLPKVTTSVAERRRIELYTSRHCQFSKHLEDTPTRGLREEEADRDLHFTKRCHQEEHFVIQRHLMEQKRLIETLQTKIKCQQDELKKAKDLDFKKSTIIYRKTTTISNLLLEIEKFQHEKKELVRIGLQLQGEKEQLSQQFEEELRRRTAIISNLLSERENLNRENKELLGICEEKQKICEHFEEELSMQKKIICDLLSDRGKLQSENKELVGVSLQLQGEKQQLCEYFDEKLSRERKLKKDCSRSLLCRDQLTPLLSREHKRCFVTIWKTSGQDRKPEDKEDLEKMKPQVLENTLKASVNNLKTKKSEESRENVLGWLQESLKNLKEVSNKASRPSLAEWLKESLINLQKESPEASTKDVNDWLNLSLNQLQESPETSHPNVQEWLETSIKEIQDLQMSEADLRSSDSRKGWLEKSKESLKKLSSEGPMNNILSWLQTSLQTVSSSTEPKPVLENWLKDSLKNLAEEHSEVDNQDVQEWLQTTVNNLEEEGLSAQEWLEESIKEIQDLQKSEADLRSSSSRKGWLEKSKESLKKLSSEGPLNNILSWLQTSLQTVSSSTEPKPVLENWLKDSLKNLEHSEVDNQDVQEWLQTTVNNLEEEGPEASHPDIQEWLEISIKTIQDLNEQYSKGRGASVEESSERVIRVELPSSEKSLRNGWLQASLSNSREHGSTASRTGLQGWLRASLGKLRQESSDRSRNNLEEWLQESMLNVQEGCPEESRQDVKEWLGISLNHLEEGGPETPHLSVEEWLKTSIQSLREENLKEMTGSTDPEMRRRKVSLFKGIPSQGKQIVRKNLGKLRICCRKKTVGAILLLAVFLFALYVYFRLYCVVSEPGLRPY